MFLKNVRANSVYTMTYVIYIKTSLQYVALSFLTTSKQLQQFEFFSKFWSWCR